MYCRRCKVKMKEEGRSFHKQRKWICPKCGREIERWQTGFYTRQPLPKRKSAAVLTVAAVAFLLIVAGFARACHWI
jgi:transposase-like protein